MDEYTTFLYMLAYFHKINIFLMFMIEKRRQDSPGCAGMPIVKKYN